MDTNFGSKSFQKSRKNMNLVYVHPLKNTNNQAVCVFVQLSAGGPKCASLYPVPRAMNLNYALKLGPEGGRDRMLIRQQSCLIQPPPSNGLPNRFFFWIGEIFFGFRVKFFGFRFLMCLASSCLLGRETTILFCLFSLSVFYDCP